MRWTLEVVFGEDGQPDTKDHGPQNMAVPRQLALPLMKLDPGKGSFRVKRKKAVREDGFRASLLHRLFPR